jgi:prevent-host-death family protein
MKTASVRDLRNHFAKVSHWLKAGEKIEITKRGVPVGMITPIAQPKNGKHAPRNRFDAEERRRWMKKTYGDKTFRDNIILSMREESDW